MMSVNNRLDLLKLKAMMERLIARIVIKRKGRGRAIKRDKTIQREIKKCKEEFKRLYSTDDDDWEAHLSYFVKLSISHNKKMNYA